MSNTSPNGTIAGQAMLVSLSFSLCRQSRQLVAEARGIEEKNHAESGTTNALLYYFKQKSGKKTIDALADLKSFFNAWRSAHAHLTRNWPGDMKLLPAPLLSRYLEIKSSYEQEAPAKVQEFMETYDDWRITAPSRMGNLFDEQDFPSKEEARADIAWHTMMIPLPDGQAWKSIALISPNLAEQMEATTNAEIAKAVEAAHKETWSDLIEPVQRIVTSLTSDKPRIFSSLITNLTDILDLGQSFNLTNDPDMTRFITEAKESLAGIDADSLRADPEVRKVAVRNAQDLLARFGQLGARKFA